MNFLLLGLFSSLILIMANSEPFPTSDLFDSSAQLFVDPGNSLDYGIEEWENADPFTSVVQPVTSLDLAFHSDDSTGDPTPSKIELCTITILPLKPYCCDGTFLPDGVMTDCIECMILMRITAGYSLTRADDPLNPRCDWALNNIYCCFENFILAFLFAVSCSVI